MNFYAITINIGLDTEIELIHFETEQECINYLSNFGLREKEEYRISDLERAGLFDQFILTSGDQHCYIDIIPRSFGIRYDNRNIII